MGSPEHAGLPNLRVVLSGAAPFDEEVAKATEARLGCRVIQGYGLSETSPVTHATRLKSDRIVVTGVGPPVPNTEARIVSIESGADCESRQHGAGELPKGFVVLKAALTSAAWRTFPQRVAPHKRLHSADFVQQIPRSPAGKILRRLLVPSGQSA
jgi:acyl-CoA synthetase (AMP-forming)/AMP-acid ligase II